MNKKLLIEGMSCAHCVNHVKTVLTEDIDGVKVIEVNLDGKYALIEVNDSVNDENLKFIIEDAGYTLKGIE